MGTAKRRDVLREVFEPAVSTEASYRSRSKRLGLRDFRTPERVSSAGSLAEGERNLRTGGEGEIRTPGTRKGTPAFEAGAIDHSATSPRLNYPDCTNSDGEDQCRAHSGFRRGPVRDPGVHGGRKRLE